MTQSLTNIARDIAREHALAQEAAASALEHARACGELLIEAKGIVAHGGWGAWLGEHFPASARTAQRYMTIAERWEELAAKTTRVADLPIREAARLLAEPKTDEPAGESPEIPAGAGEVPDFMRKLERDLEAAEGLPEGWFESRINGCPLDVRDLMSADWLWSRVQWVARVPWKIEYCLDINRRYRVPALRLCDGDDLAEAVEGLRKLLNPKTRIPDPALVDVTGLGVGKAKKLIRSVDLFAFMMMGACLEELEERETLDEAEFTRQRREAHAAMMAKLNADLEELEAAS
jgi:hypothetical protein